MTRFAREHQVFFVEEPVYDAEKNRVDVEERETNLFICVPRLVSGIDEHAAARFVSQSLSSMFAAGSSRPTVAWFYTPMMLDWADGLDLEAIVYDCMDELSAFRGAPPQLIEREKDLLARADLVFTGGRSLYEAKRTKHRSVHAFPSSVDVAHFAQAKDWHQQMPEHGSIPVPRIGYAGVIDERLDLQLLADAASERPEWSFVMIGPVVKISESDLPRNENIYYLGMKDYTDLPGYFAGWDVGMMPFALNEATKYISPTKTPEYLAAGLPVVSTAITDVVDPYESAGLVRIARSADEFVASIEAAMAEDARTRNAGATEFLGRNSWDTTQAAMAELISGVLEENSAEPNKAFCDIDILQQERSVQYV
jgi:UDP-galactopyranose mutase